MLHFTNKFNNKKEKKFFLLFFILLNLVLLPVFVSLYFFSKNYNEKGFADINNTEILNTKSFLNFQDEVNNLIVDGVKDIEIKIPIKHYPHNKLFFFNVNWETNDDWDINIDNTTIPFRRNLINNLEFVSEIDNYFIYAKSDIQDFDFSQLNNQNVSFLTTKVPPYLINEIPKEISSKSNEYKLHTIGDIKFYFLSSGKTTLGLEINNTSCGDDILNHNYYIQILDLDNKTVISKTFPVIQHSLTLSALPTDANNLYSLTISFDKRLEDCAEISSIKINTPKIVTTGPVRITPKTVLYIQPTKQTHLNFLSTDIDPQDVILQINGTIQTILPRFYNPAKLNFEPIEYLLSANKVITIDGGNFSFTKDSFFKPFIFQESNYTWTVDSEPDYVITNFKQSQDSSEIKIPIAFFQEYSNNRELSFSLINCTVLQDYHAIKFIADRGYPVNLNLRNSPLNIKKILWEIY